MRRMRPPALTIAIASDLHVAPLSKKSGHPAPSFLRYGEASTAADATDPFQALQDLIQKENLEADYLVCPGDIAHQADRQGLQYGWELLEKLRKKLRARMLLATTGNHDLTSRGSSEAEPQDTLRALKPIYPVKSKLRTLEYWASNFTEVRKGDVARFLLLNSCAHHAGPREELEHGRISSSTLGALRAHLAGTTPATVNILICHHHPQQHQEIALGDYDVMKNGQLLLELLSEPRVGHWLVIHGHKHHPKMTYSAGSAASAVIFSAGSLSACLYPELSTRARNQFYIVDLSLSPIQHCGLAGVVRSWSWAFGRGWLPSDNSSGLPHLSGFGCRIDPRQLARSVASFLNKPIMAWDEVLEANPHLRYVLASDFNAMRAVLREEASIEIVMNDGAPYQIGRAQA